MQLSGPNFVYHPQYFLCAVGKVFISDLFDSEFYAERKEKFGHLYYSNIGLLLHQSDSVVCSFLTKYNHLSFKYFPF